jgi:hypothetical protein
MHRILAVGEIHRLGYVKPQHSNEGLTSNNTQSLKSSKIQNMRLAVVFVCCVHEDRKRTIPTEGPPLVGEISANFCG